MTNPSAVTTTEFDTDRSILSILGRDPRDAARIKEQQLGDLFATLAIEEAKAFYKRFTRPADDELVAAQFARLPYEGRRGLTLFLADARRRAAHELVGY